MNRMSLKFLSNDSSAELFESEFSCPLVGRPLRCARGRQAFTDCVDGTFLWTAAVQSMSAVAIKSKIAQLTRKSPEAWPQAAGLCSDSTSWALSLDFALSKKPRWLLDMFGVDRSGTSIIKRLFIRMNPEKKRSGPSWVSINPAFLEPRNIAIFLDGTEVAEVPELVKLLKLIGLNAESTDPGMTESRKPLRRRKFKTGEETGSYVVEPPIYRTSGKVESTKEVAHDGDRSGGLLKELPENSDELMAPLFGTLFSDPWWVETLARVIREEVSAMLTYHSIFRPEILQAELTSIYSSAHYRAVASRNLQLTSDIDLALGSSARLGVIEQEFCKRNLGALGRPLNISLAVTLVPSLALLSYLQHEVGVPLNVNYRHANSLEIIRSLQRDNFEAAPDGIVMGLMPAVTFLSQRSRPPYRPLMIMPKASNRLVATRGSKTSKRARIVLPSDLPTSASFILDSMLASGRITRTVSKIEHLEPDEIILKIQEAADDFRSILWFPHYRLNQILHGCHIFQPDSRAEDLPTILLVHEKLMYNVKLVTALDVSLRDAWLRLRLGGARLDRVINRLVSDSEYLELFTRYTGLYAVDQKYFQRAKEAQHACG